MEEKTAEEEKKKEEKARKSLIYSIMDGAFYSSMVGFGESFFSAFAIFLKATNFQLGLLGALPQAVGSVSQLVSDKLIELFGSRKKVVVMAAVLQAMMYIAVALVFFMGNLKVYYLILFISLYWIFGLIANPAWSSWMGDLVKENERGSYFGRRNKIGGLVSFAAMLIGGFILQEYSYGASQYLGFVVIFSIALASRLVSFGYLMMKYEPKYSRQKESYFSFLEFIKKARFNNYGLFVIYLCCMNFAVFVAGPYFAAYMLNDLQMSYWTFTLINGVSLIVKFLAMPIWGRASDKFGTIKLLSLSSFLMPLVPVLWLFSHNAWYLVAIQVYSGLVWAGFEITSFNFIFDTTTPQKRALCVSYYNALNGIFIIAGALIGSVLLKYNALFWSKYLYVFLISCLLRYMAAFYFVPKLKEVRQVERSSYREVVLHMISLTPTTGLMHRLLTFEAAVEGEIKKRFKKS